MMATTRTRVLLLVEDNPGDAQLVEELLSEQGGEDYQIVHARRMSEAIETLRAVEVDVVLLDLRLPDCTGVDSVIAIRDRVNSIPIVVLTGSDDDELAIACIDAGAQDYLAKSEVRARNLRRAIGYAVTRLREAQLREMQETLERYRTLSTATQTTTVTAALAGAGPLVGRHPDLHSRLVAAYLALLEPYLSREFDRVEAPRDHLERIVTALGDAGGGPRDLLDVHVSALDNALNRQDDPHTRSVVYEARLLALEMMGLLVDYYRVGHRRRFTEGTP